MQEVGDVFVRMDALQFRGERPVWKDVWTRGEIPEREGLGPSVSKSEDLELTVREREVS